MVEDFKVRAVLEEYHRRLKELDAWFASVRARYEGRMQCGKGCTDCCCGLFDIPLPDAVRVAEGFRRLHGSVSNNVLFRASAIHARILEEAPELVPPFFLDRISESRIDELADCLHAVPCPFLDEDGRCLIYEYRPSACILEGVPMVDARDGLFDDWCARNFAGGIERKVAADLQLDYYDIEANVQRVSAVLKQLFPVFPQEESTVFIPSVIVAYENFWNDLRGE